MPRAGAGSAGRAAPASDLRSSAWGTAPSGRAPAWGSARACQAAASLREAPTDYKLEARRARVMGRAADAGLLGVHSRPEDVFTRQPSRQELYDLSQLRAATQQVAHESVDPGRLQSALTHWELWKQEVPSRVQFVPLAGAGSPGADEAARYNAETFELFAASCFRRGSLQPGRIGNPIEPDTVAGYVSAIRALLSRDGGIQVRSATHDVRIKAVSRGIRRARGPRKTRRRRLGLRARHLRAAVSCRSFDRRRTWAARRRWLAAVLAHSLLARGGELGRVDGKAFRHDRGLRWRDVLWHAVGAIHPTHAALTVHMCSVKDGDGGGVRHPIPIRRRAAGDAPGLDPLCSYDLLREAWCDDVAVLGESAALDAPIFRRSARGGVAEAYSTADVCRIVREVAVAAGENPEDFAAHSMRIGGATDLRELYDRSAQGLDEARRVLKKRGRWLSDIAFIYARASLDTSLEASARLADVQGRDVEAMFAGWAEPAA